MPKDDTYRVYESKGLTKEQAEEAFRQRYHRAPAECKLIKGRWHVGPVPKPAYEFDGTWDEPGGDDLLGSLNGRRLA